MAYVTVLLLLGLVLGLIAVASNPAPYFAAFGLVIASGLGCGVLLGLGGSFLSLILFLIYLGGMLVVFAYSAALASDPHPVSWGDRSVAGYFAFYVVAVVAAFCWGGAKGGSSLWVLVDEFKDFVVLRGDMAGAALMYSWGGEMLVITAWVLLLALFVVLELTRGLNRGALRAV